MAGESGEREAPSVAGVVPRWEWRSFGDRFDDADELLAGLAADRVQESDEVYFLSLNSDASVKVRDGLMDVKRLVQVDEQGLELWTPVMKAGFPLSATDAAAVLESLGVAGTALALASYTLDELVGDVIAPDPTLRTVRVHKQRVHHVIDECIVESTELAADGVRATTLAIESPDPALVAALVDRLGVAGRRNVCVARGLKSMVGFGTRRFAVIDVGTNSVKFHLGERRADDSLVTLVDRAEITRLGEGQDVAGVLADAAIARTVEEIVTMVDEASRAGATALVAVGTAGLRRAPNRAVLVDAVHDRVGVAVEVISGDEEGELAYLAATSALPMARGRLLVFDSGGGSTQFSFGRDEHVVERFSLDVGAVRISERFGLASAVPESVLDAALAELASELDRLDGRPQLDAVVAIGGTATNLAAVKHRSSSTTRTTCTGRSSISSSSTGRSSCIEHAVSRTGASSPGSSRLAPK